MFSCCRSHSHFFRLFRISVIHECENVNVNSGADFRRPRSMSLPFVVQWVVVDWKRSNKLHRKQKKSYIQREILLEAATTATLSTLGFSTRDIWIIEWTPSQQQVESQLNEQKKMKRGKGRDKPKATAKKEGERRQMTQQESCEKTNRAATTTRHNRQPS